uniref:RNA-directed DNA polymerase n=1 Tax=Romanomermis culicivorax TaxID=13658 RepID=A0A915L0X5_ROMCU
MPMDTSDPRVQLTHNGTLQYTNFPRKAQRTNFRDFTKNFELLVILKKNNRHPDPTSYATVGTPVHRNSRPIDVEAATQHHQCKDESTSEFLSRLQTLQVDCKYDNFNADTDLPYMLAQNCYLQDTQKWLFLSHTATLDVYVNIMQAAQSAESSSAAIRGVRKMSMPSVIIVIEIATSIVVEINRRINQSTHNHVQGQSIARAAVRQVICIYRPILQRKGQQMLQLWSYGTFCKVFAATTYECTFCVIHRNGEDCYTSGIVDSGAEASLLPQALYTKWIGAPLSKLKSRLFSSNNTEIAGLTGPFTPTIEYNGCRAKVTLLVLDTIKVGTWGTDTIEALQFVINGTTGQINFVQPIDSTPPATAVQSVQSTPAANDAIPVAGPVRQVPIACCAAVEEEDEQMVTDDIWEPVTTSRLLLKADQIVVPSKLCRQLMNKAHKGHPSIVRAKIKLGETYWWPGIAADIEETICHCQGCQDSAKSNPQSTIPTDPLRLRKAPWEEIAIEVTGPFATAPYQNQFAIVVISYLCGFPEVRLCPDHTAERTIKFLTKLFACYDVAMKLEQENVKESQQVKDDNSQKKMIKFNEKHKHDDENR